MASLPQRKKKALIGETCSVALGKFYRGISGVHPIQMGCASECGERARETSQGRPSRLDRTFRLLGSIQIGERNVHRSAGGATLIIHS